MVKFCYTHIPNLNEVTKLLTLSKEQQMSNFGPVYQLLQKQLNQFLQLPNDKDIVIVSSGHIAIMSALGILKSKKVLLPAYTFTSTLQAITLQNIQPIISDVSNNGYLTLEIIERQYKQNKFDTVLLVTPLSVIPNIQDIYQWCQKKKIKLIIDGAASFGTKNIANYCDAYCLSFHATKSFPVGEGGAIIIHKELISKVKSYINFGMNEKREIIMSGLNGKISEYTAAIALALLNEIKPDINRRLKNSFLLTYLLYNNSLLTIPTSNVPDTVYQTFPIYIKPNYTKKIYNELINNQIDCRQYYQPIKSLKNTNSLFQTNICIPCHPNVQEKDIQLICEIINKYEK